jgi:hypothetical protein
VKRFPEYAGPVLIVFGIVVLIVSDRVTAAE